MNLFARSLLVFTLLPLISCGSSNPAGSPVIPKQSYVYVANSTDWGIEVFSVDSVSGALTPYQTVPLATPPFALALKSTGDFLYYTDSLQVFALAVGKDGKLTSVGSPLDAGVGCARLVSAGSYVYAACSMAIAAYKIERNGTLTVVSGSPFSGHVGTGGMSIDPTGHVLYTFFNGSTNGYLSSFALDSSTGSVSSAGTDKMFLGQITGIDIDPSGKYLYVVTSTVLGGPLSDSLSKYAIQSDASLTSVSSSPLDPAPSALALDPSGKLFYLTFQINTRVESLVPDTSGVLTKTGYSQPLPLTPMCMQVDASGKVLVLSLYGNQGLFAFPTDSTGKLSASSSTFLQGKSLYSIVSGSR